MASSITKVVDPPSRFVEAIEAFKAKSGLTPKELFDIEMTSLDDLRRTLATIQHKQQRTKTERFLKRLRPFLDTMEQYSSVLGIFSNASDIVAFIWVRRCYSPEFLRLYRIGSNEVHSTRKTHKLT